ncbi:MAG: trypsin-like peptidase domain-containing protein [Planctomycetota bacterium]
MDCFRPHHRHHRRNRLTLPVGALRAASLAAACLASLVVRAASSQAEQTAEPLDIPDAAARVLDSQLPKSVADLRAIEAQLQRVAERAVAATVSVQVQRAIGSGVAVSKEGTVLTAAHVIGRPGRTVFVTLHDGRRLRGKSLGANRDGDAGLIQLDDPPADLPYAPLCKDGDLKIGEWVVTTGHSGGYLSDRASPVRLGRVLSDGPEFVCTDCTLVGGDSGGPLFNMRGEVVGIHSSIGPLVTQNFHVPVRTYVEGWDRMVAGEIWGGKEDDASDGEGYPVLGVSGRTIEGQCEITQVHPGLPAAAAGIEPGDIVLAVDNRPIASFDKLVDIVYFKRPGQRLNLKVLRSDRELELTVRIGAVERPLPGSRPRRRSGENGDSGAPGEAPSESE